MITYTYRVKIQRNQETERIAAEKGYSAGGEPNTIITEIKCRSFSDLFIKIDQFGESIKSVELKSVVLEGGIIATVSP